MLAELEHDLADCTRAVHFDPDAAILRHGDLAEAFYLITEGMVAVEVAFPGADPVLIETLEAGEILGWSWMFAPWRWHFDARALTPVEALAFDAEAVHRRCEADPALGRALMTCFAQVLYDRLQWTRLRLLDVYGHRQTS